MLSGGANALTTYTGFAVVLFSGVAVLSLFVLRRSETARPATVPRAGAIPWRPRSSRSQVALIVANALWSDLVMPIHTGTAWGPAAAGLIIIGLGVPIYFFFAKRSEHPALGVEPGARLFSAASLTLMRGS